MRSSYNANGDSQPGGHVSSLFWRRLSGWEYAEVRMCSYSSWTVGPV